MVVVFKYLRTKAYPQLTEDVIGKIELWCCFVEWNTLELLCVILKNEQKFRQISFVCDVKYFVFLLIWSFRQYFPKCATSIWSYAAL